MSIDNNIDVSKDELLAWFALKPQTAEFDAILAYDKEDTNRVLQNEYIARQNTKDIMDPIDEEHTEGSLAVTKTWLFGYIFDRPRLTFENANIAESKAMLTSKVIDGILVTFEELGQEWKVTKMEIKSPLTASLLTTPINLLNVVGSVSDVGRVVLDISKGLDYQLSDGDEPHLHKILGKLVGNALGRMRAEQREYELNVVQINDDDYLKPKEFVLRTHTTADATVKGSRTFGEGQVLQFVTMEGGENGDIPPTNKDQRYLLPAPHTAALVLGHQFMFKKIIEEGCKGIINAGTDYTIRHEGPDGGFVQKLTVTNGERRQASTGPVTNLPHFASVDILQMAVGLGKKFVDLAPGDSTFYIDFKDEALAVTWEGTKEQPAKITTKGGTSFLDNVGTQWRMKKSFKFILLESGDLQMVVDTNNDELLIRALPEKYTDIPEVSAYFDEIAGYVENRLKVILEEGMAAFLDRSRLINQMLLTNLLFRGEQAVKMESVHLPGDFVSFGKVGAKYTKFQISPIETYIGLGKPIQFTVDPADEVVTWSVEHIGEEDGSPGAINASGLYLAPATIAGRYLRVRVKASAGDYTSFASVFILVNELDITPQIQMVAAGSSLGRRMKAGALGETDLKWEVVNGDATGSRVVPDEEDEDYMLYFSGPPNPDELFTVDEIKVSTFNAPVKTASTFVVVSHVVLSENITIMDAPSLPDDQIQLQILDRQGDPYDPEDYEWLVLKGAGEVNLAGIVTVDTTSPFPYVVVRAVLKGRDYAGIILLPVPAFTIPEAIKMLRA